MHILCPLPWYFPNFERIGYSLLCILAQERVGKLRHNESRLEDDKKNLRIALEDAENRCTKLELARRSAEGELQRFKLAMNDKDTENQVCDKKILRRSDFNLCDA